MSALKEVPVRTLESIAHDAALTHVQRKFLEAHRAAYDAVAAVLKTLDGGDRYVSLFVSLLHGEDGQWCKEYESVANHLAQRRVQSKLFELLGK